MADQTSTPDEVLERTYRRLVEHADAMGITRDEALTQILPATAAELRGYIARVYA